MPPFTGTTYKPLNTLSQPSKQATNTRPIHAPGQLPTSASRGGNVSKRKHDMNSEHQSNAGADWKKRRKEEMNGSGTTPISSPAVDLTNEDNSPQGKTAVGVYSGSQESVEEVPPRRIKLPFFANNESKKVDERMRVTRLRRRSQENQEAFNDRRAQKVLSGSPVSSKNLVIEIKSPEGNYQSSRKNHLPSRRPITPSKGIQRPLINLDEGMPESPRLKREPDDKDDLKVANQVLRYAERQRRLKEASSREFNGISSQNVQNGPKKGGPVSISSSNNRDRDGRGGLGLHEQFQRADSSHSRPLRQTAVSRMQTSSTKFQVPMGLPPKKELSDDELQGEKNVGSQPSRNSPPKKRTVERPSTSEEGKISLQQRTHSPSDLPPTQFKSLGDQHTRTRRHAKSLSPEEANPKAEEDDGTAEIRIPVRSIYARGCVSIHRDAELVWNQGLLEFSIEHNGVKYQAHHTSAHFRIGRGEVNHGWASSPGSQKVLLRGSRSEFSNGSILIEFHDGSGMMECFDGLLCATSDDLNFENIQNERMEKIFWNKSKELSQDFHKQAEKRHLRAKETYIQERSVIQKDRTQEEDERIIYESDSSPPQRLGTLRSQIEGESLPNTTKRQEQKRQTQTTEEVEYSKYFAPTRRSSRQSKPDYQPKPRTPSPPKWTQIEKPKRWARSVVYPATGLRRVTVDFDDLERLDEREFLNDNVLSFALRHIEETMEPTYRDQVHFFNSFFFSALLTKNGRKAFNYDAVKRWTKNIDLFDVPYIVVPINLDLHWFVAIICNLPNLERKLTGTEDDVEEVAKPPSKVTEEIELPDKAASDEISNKPESPDAVEQMGELSISEKATSSPNLNQSAAANPEGAAEHNKADTIEAKAPGKATSSTSNKRPKKSGPPLKKYSSDDPVIMTLDSFGQTRGTEIRYLKDYISAEADAKRAMYVETRQIQGLTAKGIPEQSNFSDCGVYLVGYMEQFAKNPRQFINKILNRELDKSNDFADFHPSIKRAEIREKLLELSAEQDAAHKAQKKAKVNVAKSGSASKSEKKTKGSDQSAAATPQPSHGVSPVEYGAEAKTSLPKHNADAHEMSAAKETPLPADLGKGEGKTVESAHSEVADRSHSTRTEQPKKAQTPASKEDTSSSDEHEKDEMLDHADTSNINEHEAHPRIEERSKGAPVQDVSIQGVPSQVQSMSPTIADSQTTQLEEADNALLKRGREDESDELDADRGRQKSVKLDDEQEKPAEVPDSQE